MVNLENGQLRHHLLQADRKRVEPSSNNNNLLIAGRDGFVNLLFKRRLSRSVMGEDMGHGPLFNTARNPAEPPFAREPHK